MLGQTQGFAPQIRSFDLARGSVNEESRTVDLVFSTDTDKVERWFGVEILDHGPKSVRMDRLKNAAPLLLDHDTRQQIGVVETADIDGKAGKATVRFSKSAKGEEVFRDVLDGIRTKVSVGYRVHGLKLETSDKKSGRDTYRVNDWEPFEVSLVSVPADDSAGIRESDSIFGKRAASLSTNVTMKQPNSDNQGRSDDSENVINDPVAAAVAAAEIQAVRSLEPDKEASKADLSRMASEMASLEVQRREDIRAIGETVKAAEAEIKEAIRNNVTADEFKLRAFDKLAAANPAYSGQRQEDQLDKPEAGTRAAMLTGFAEAAKPVLAARGIQFIVPDYSKQADIQRNYIDSAGDQFHRSMTGAVTLVDVAKLDAGIGSPLISEVAMLAPEVRTFPVDIIQGGSVEISVNTTSATVGFRNANEGTTPSIGEFESRIFQTQVIEHPVIIDIQGVLNASKDPARTMASTARTVLEGVMKHIGVQTWYGGTAQSGADTKAFAGLLAQSNTASTHVVDADGSTALTSVFMVRLGDTYCDHVYGNGTTLNMGEWMEETVQSSADKKLRALVTYLSGRLTARLSNKNALVRIKKIGTDSTKKLTDLLLFSAYEKFLTLGQEPNAIYMTPRSLEQLRASRTATNPTGAPAPIPTDWNGIPIYLTNSISHAETV